MACVVLKKLSEHIWYMPFEEERDRPNLGYVKGDKLSLAIDAGQFFADRNPVKTVRYPCKT